MVFSQRVLLLLIACLLLTAPRALAAGNPAPNVVVITIDTLRPDHVGCYGYKQITPRISMRLRQMASVSSVPILLYR